MQETQVQSLGQEDSLEKKMAAHCSILAGRIPWTEEPGGPQSWTWLSDCTTTTTEHSNAMVPERPLVESGTLLWGPVPPSSGLVLWSGGAHRRFELLHCHKGDWLELGPCPADATYTCEILGKKPDLFEPPFSHLSTGAWAEGFNETAWAKHTVSAQ